MCTSEREGVEGERGGWVGGREPVFKTASQTIKDTMNLRMCEY